MRARVRARACVCVRVHLAGGEEPVEHPAGVRQGQVGRVAAALVDPQLHPHARRAAARRVRRRDAAGEGEPVAGGGRRGAAVVRAGPVGDGRERAGVRARREDGALEEDGGVGRAVDVQDADRPGGRAVAGAVGHRTGEHHRGGDLPRQAAGERVRHEPAVGVADNVDAGRVDGEPGPGLGEEAREVRKVVDAGAEEVAAGPGRGVPKAEARLVQRPVRHDEHGAARGGELGEVEVLGVGGAADREVALEEEDERGGRSGLVRRGDERRRRATSAEGADGPVAGSGARRSHCGRCGRDRRCRGERVSVAQVGAAAGEVEDIPCCLQSDEGRDAVALAALERKVHLNHGARCDIRFAARHTLRV